MTSVLNVSRMPMDSVCRDLLSGAAQHLRRLRGARYAGLPLALLLVVTALIAVPMSAQAQVTVGAKALVASGYAGVGFASDGNNFLVPLETSTAVANVAAQLMSSTGVPIGSLVSLGTNGQSCCASGAAFDGSRYLVVWEDDGGIKNSPTPFRVFGQFITAAGAKDGAAIAMTTTGIWFDGMNMLAYGGGKYLLTYTRLIDPAKGEDSTNRYVAGLIIAPDGTLGSEFRISSGYGSGSSVAFDGTNFFVTWKEDQYDSEVRGAFISTTGAKLSEISINASVLKSDNPVPLAFDGTNYAVMWTDRDDATGQGDVFAQRISPAGALVGGVITINGDAGMQLATGIAFDGTNYVATWIDMTNDANGNGLCDTGEGTCWDVYGQYVGKDGVLVGSKFAINTDAGNQMGGVGCANGKCMALVSSGIVMGQGGPSQVGSVYVSSLASTASGTAISLAQGWNLMGYSGSAAIDLGRFNTAANVQTVWKWVPGTQGRWAFYAPSLEANGSLATYASSKGYDVLTTINPGDGFWVNALQPHTVSLPR